MSDNKQNPVVPTARHRELASRIIWGAVVVFAVGVAMGIRLGRSDGQQAARDQRQAAVAINHLAKDSVPMQLLDSASVREEEARRIRQAERAEENAHTTRKVDELIQEYNELLKYDTVSFRRAVPPRHFTGDYISAPSNDTEHPYCEKYKQMERWYSLYEELDKIDHYYLTDESSEKLRGVRRDTIVSHMGRESVRLLPYALRERGHMGRNVGWASDCPWSGSLSVRLLTGFRILAASGHEYSEVGMTRTSARSLMAQLFKKEVVAGWGSDYRSEIRDLGLTRYELGMSRSEWRSYAIRW
jgi:hypothetical protein